MAKYFWREKICSGGWEKKPGSPFTRMLGGKCLVRALCCRNVHAGNGGKCAGIWVDDLGFAGIAFEPILLGMLISRDIGLKSWHPSLALSSVGDHIFVLWRSSGE